ncbi:Fe2+-enterobactin ABC transporter substrate-binding protein [Gulosibacter sp. 10]|uniref:Fe2+-enterobactin ABC transporter substrate-binding protein n=1 Tax=Gulosibacter sp. 10 TaxID=1255570 RepID=UPI00097F3677|nr:Fe2+-enterobactin ABC transporter substrate-binding protein [Gulosibacter sp. 10]SJM65260.1 Ferrienterobactin-binding periplasmic protein FepB (TC 3.A.1.14.2) [Gulosibacter sp. 10]
MNRSRSTRSRLLAGLAALSVGALALAGCASDAAPESTGEGDASSTDGGTWPRTFENADGTTTEIPEQPQNIVSTSVSVSGTLLAIDAPLVASGTDAAGDFFAQWADVAEEQGVENLWSAGEVDIEAAYAYDADLIVVAATGADSVADQVAELQQIAPTIVVDYGAQTWQDLAVELGEATGLEEQAQASIDEFDAYVEDAASSITVPEGQANIVSYNGPSEGNPIGRAEGPHGQLLAQLGFEIEEPNPDWHTQPQEREDFVFASYENLTELTADTTFILSQDDEGAKAFVEDPTLANLPSVQDGQVYGLGLNSFRIDKYSATEIVDSVVNHFGN